MLNTVGDPSKVVARIKEERHRKEEERIAKMKAAMLAQQDYVKSQPSPGDMVVGREYKCDGWSDDIMGVTFEYVMFRELIKPHHVVKYPGTNIHEYFNEVKACDKESDSSSDNKTEEA